MTSAHRTKMTVSALDQRRNHTAPVPSRADVTQAITDIRAAVATLARLVARDAAHKGGQQ